MDKSEWEEGTFSHWQIDKSSHRQIDMRFETLDFRHKTGSSQVIPTQLPCFTQWPQKSNAKTAKICSRLRHRGRIPLIPRSVPMERKSVWLFILPTKRSYGTNCVQVNRSVWEGRLVQSLTNGQIISLSNWIPIDKWTNYLIDKLIEIWDVRF